MDRILFEMFGFFLLPFLAYAAFLTWEQRHPRAARAIFKQKALIIQSLLGLVIVIVLLLVLGVLEDRYQGGYVPAMFKNGQLQPARVE